MDPLSYFSPEELRIWSTQYRQDCWLMLTWLLLKYGFYGIVLLGGFHLSLKSGSEALAGRLYVDRPEAPTGPLGRIRLVFERLGGSPQAPRQQWLVYILYPSLFTLVWFALSLPLSFFGSYVLEHERGLATITLGQWWTDSGKSLTMTLLFGGVFGLGVFGLIRRLPRSWWLWLWLAVVGALWLWSMLVPARSRLYHDYRALPEGELKRSIAEVLEQAHLKLDQVKVVDTSRRSRVATAYLMGVGPSKTVVLGDNLVKDFPVREIRVAVAHEIGHHLMGDQVRDWIQRVVATLVFLLLVQWILRRGHRLRRLGLTPGADPAALPLVLLVLNLMFLVNSPLSAHLSRAEEQRADLKALELTRDPEALVSLMVRLARVNQFEVDPPSAVHWFLWHHPSIKQRIRFAYEWAKSEQAPFDAKAIPLPSPAIPGSPPPDQALE